LKFSKVTVPTLKEKPADAEIASHELLIRAGMMRSVAAGIYTFLPLGSSALAKVENIVRDEMNRAGACEIVLPNLHPAEAWRESGRWFQYGPEMMRLKDRQGREFCLGPTAEELVTLAVSRSAPSYRDLPVNLYQIQTKYRDEVRPRFGLLRCREFRMKDAYSFHTSFEDLDDTYRRMYEAYVAVAKRCSLDVRVVEAPTGLIGGDISHEFMVLSSVGEDIVVHCLECDYGANSELERHRPGKKFGTENSLPLEEVHTPCLVSVSEVASFLDSSSENVIKCVLYVAGDELIAAFVPGYRELSEAKLARILGTDNFHQMREDERELFPQVTAGFVGPVGLSGVKMLFDEELKGAKGLICGANKFDYHYRGVEEGRDFKAEPLVDIALATEGDRCVECGGELAIARGIEIGHIFKLGEKYSKPLNALFTDADGILKPIIMGTYGIGTSRMLATIVEQHHDENGIKWPKAVAPVDIEVIVLNPDNDEQSNMGREIYQKMMNAGFDVLLDERELSPGVKFNDADLIGVPLQVIVGKKTSERKTVDLKVRYTGEKLEFEAMDVGEKIINVLENVP